MTLSESNLSDREGMNVGLYSAIIHSRILSERGSMERAYEASPSTAMYWCFIDLVSSSNHRIARGARAGYLRGETFLRMVRAIVSYCPKVRLIKEIGDSTFLAGDFQDLLECLVLIDHEAFQMRQLSPDLEFPFAIRGGINYGPAKRLVRPNEDFIGSTIDQLARLMGERHPENNLFIQAEAYSPMEQVVADYSAFLKVEPPVMLSAAASKGMQKPLYFHWLQIDRAALVEFGQFFNNWRNAVRRQDIGTLPTE